MNCEFAHLDAVYVLGSLSAAERAEYERHLPGCEECSRAVRELAGLPGLLSKVPLEVVEPPGEHEPAPETLLPAVVSEARRSLRRRRSAIVAIVAAAAAIVVVGVTGVVVAGLDDDGDAPPVAAPSASESIAPAVQMESLGPGWVTGWVSLTERKWGTRIDLTCTYNTGDGYADWPSYAMLVRSTDGQVEQVGTWRAEPGREMHVTLATSSAPEDIEAVLVKTVEGTSVLRLTQ
ncbi:MAG TPA: zf-HC2 domain-containing protein [Nocardioides sp.]|nr:zf-HC2 domain-containing protein [Nocardioides sp.]